MRFAKVGRGVHNCAMTNATMLLVALLITLAPHNSSGQATPAPKPSPSVLRKLLVEPSSTSLAGGKARLIVTALHRQAGIYAGDYQLKVIPYFFKSEKGKLAMIITDQSLLKLTQNIPVEFTGKATTIGSKKTRAITAKATPSAPDRGALTISVVTENGALVFNTSYRFAEK